MDVNNKLNIHHEASSVSNTESITPSYQECCEYIEKISKTWENWDEPEETANIKAGIDGHNKQVTGGLEAPMQNLSTSENKTGNEIEDGFCHDADELYLDEDDLYPEEDDERFREENEELYEDDELTEDEEPIEEENDFRNSNIEIVNSESASETISGNIVPPEYCQSLLEERAREVGHEVWFDGRLFSINSTTCDCNVCVSCRDKAPRRAGV